MDLNNIDPKNLPADFNIEMGLDWYVDELIKQKPEFNNLDGESLSAVKEDLKSRAENYINIAILKNVPESKLDEFEKLLDNNDANQIQAFCSQTIPDLNQVVAMALINFRDSYLNI